VIVTTEPFCQWHWCITSSGGWAARTKSFVNSRVQVAEQAPQIAAQAGERLIEASKHVRSSLTPQREYQPQL
jgi:hypothetical protein